MKTAVEWLEEHIKKVDWIDKKLSERMDIIQQAKEMEKAEKIKAQIESVRAVDTYGLKHMIEHYENQLKELNENKEQFWSISHQ